MLKILYFGKLGELTQLREERVDVPNDINTIEALKSWLNTRHDLDCALSHPSIKTMIDQKLVHTNESIEGAQEIGFLPPVGGG
ncbi:MAG: molybdopterin synthase sulfur carrier subunit [Robiginitomaculum sp.]|nr:MAG: molybdopterin synthase sulfur carrier subunit [Robiginitomaculum sp.]